MWVFKYPKFQTWRGNFKGCGKFILYLTKHDVIGTQGLEPAQQGLNPSFMPDFLISYPQAEIASLEVNTKW